MRVLATSRHRLGLTEEHLLEVRPLQVPDPDDDLSDIRLHPALALFADRAAAVVPGFALTPANRASVARLCRRLDGLPLAIELAAVRMRVLGVDQLLDRLDDRYRLLAAGSPAVPPRHRTLRAAVDWSHELCTPQERAVWARASVLAGTFDLATAEAVCADPPGAAVRADTGRTDPQATVPITPYDVLEALAGLVDKSVLIREEQPQGTVRYRLLDTLRHYGLDLLRRTPGAEAAARRRQRDWTQTRVAAYERAWFGPRQRDIVARLRADRDSLRTALEFSLATPGEALAGLRLAGTLWFFWHACGERREGRYWLDRALEANPEPTPERARALWTSALLTDGHGPESHGPESHGPESHGPENLAVRARELARTLGEPVEAAHAEHVLDVLHLLDGDLPAALAHCSATAARVPVPGTHPAVVALGHVQLAHALALLGHAERAQAVCERVLRRCERRGEDWVRSYALRAMAVAHTAREEWHRAESYAREALRRASAVHDLLGVGLTLDLLISITTALGAHGRAAALLGGADRVWSGISTDRLGSPAHTCARHQGEARAREALGRRSYERSYRRGAAMDLDETVAYALQEGLREGLRGGLQRGLQESVREIAERSEPSSDEGSVTEQQAPSASTPPAPLTARETEVARLVAEGLANQQIADRLVIARRTAEGHVERILGKLGFHNRSQIAAWATAQSLTAQR
ncbi:hypothetical protein SGFS_046020 [Streptomyces graminofaciens]|uniref:HTH luxR-type domain-containing protein n=1 Tax=Streptomyces graminofaciens TaxID=68212 RepID=A0ABN5VIV4_9ACTN|nr:hypothetical protein SGFS_046020 [Streptomyces graminofaciens]